MRAVTHMLEGREIEISKIVANQPGATTISTHGHPSSRPLTTSATPANSPPVHCSPLRLQLGPYRTTIHTRSCIPHTEGIGPLYAWIDAACNKITSIESMVRMQAPFLEDINLRKGEISRRQSDPQCACT